MGNELEFITFVLRSLQHLVHGPQGPVALLVALVVERTDSQAMRNRSILLLPVNCIDIVAEVEFDTEGFEVSEGFLQPRSFASSGAELCIMKVPRRRRLRPHIVDPGGEVGTAVEVKGNGE